MCTRLCETCVNLDYGSDGEICMCGQTDRLYWSSFNECAYYFDESYSEKKYDSATGKEF